MDEDLSGLSGLQKRFMGAGWGFADSLLGAAEGVFPWLKDSDGGTHGFTSEYLKAVDIPRKEKLKRRAKAGVRSYFAVLFFSFSAVAVALPVAIVRKALTTPVASLPSWVFGTLLFLAYAITAWALLLFAIFALAFLAMLSGILKE